MEKTKDIKVIENLIQKDKIATLNIINLIENKKHWEIMVDNIDNPKGLIFKSDGWYIPYSPYDEVAFNMLKNIEVKKGELFSGILKKYYDYITDFKEIDWEEQCLLYYMKKDDLKFERKKHKVEELRLKDAEIVNEFYTYKDENSLEYIKDRITRGITSAVFDKNYNPISWAVVREDGSMGIMYTKKEHRGKGIAASVSIDLANKVINNNKTPFVHIVSGNDASVSLAKSIGFRKYGDVVWFGVK